MRIEIDTQSDSKESIKKVIRLLHDLVDEPLSNYPSSNQAPLSQPSLSSNPSEGFMNIFGPIEPPAPQSTPVGSSLSSPQPAGQTAPASGFFDLFKSDNQTPSQPAPSSLSTTDLLAQADNESYDEEYDDLDKGFKKPVKPTVVREGDLKGKKINIPDNEISIIEY